MSHGTTEEDLIARAAAVESNSEHPLAKAIVAAAGTVTQPDWQLRILRRLLVEERRRSFAIEQSERRGSHFSTEPLFYAGLRMGVVAQNTVLDLVFDAFELRLLRPDWIGRTMGGVIRYSTAAAQEVWPGENLR